MRIIPAIAALFLSLTFGASIASSATVTIGASKDNSLYEGFVDNSGGGSAGIFVGTTGIPTRRRGLIAFDVAGNVPAGATISSVQLTLYLGKIGGASSQTIELHRLSADWGEGTAGSSNQIITDSGKGYAAGPGDATWNARSFGTSLWSNPGATGDFNATASASAVISTIVSPPTPSTWSSTSGLVGDVQSWLDSPATNFGWIMINANEVPIGSALAFYSRSATTDAGGDPLDPIARPALTITYTSVPEPTAVALFLLAGATSCFRRRGR